MPSPPVPAACGWNLGRGRVVTSNFHDDTHMALALGRTLRDAGGTLDQQQLGDTFAEAYAAEPWRGYGAGPPRVFALARRGTSYVEAAGSLFDDTGSFGNGAAMRVTPVALDTGGDRRTQGS
jgi:poly(ADP-ribose) glycohydrolase ARH3